MPTRTTANAMIKIIALQLDRARIDSWNPMAGDHYCVVNAIDEGIYEIIDSSTGNLVRSKCLDSCVFFHETKSVLIKRCVFVPEVLLSRDGGGPESPSQKSNRQCSISDAVLFDTVKASYLCLGCSMPFTDAYNLGIHWHEKNKC